MKSARKLLCLALAALLMLALCAPALAAGDVAVDAAHFPDKAFREYVQKNCDTNGNGKLSAAEIAAVASLDLTAAGIADLTGVRTFTALQELFCFDNPLTALDVSGLTELRRLDCSGLAKLTALNVTGCAALETLLCSSCALTALDLTGCEALTRLECSYNPLTALDVSGCEPLTYLGCAGCALTGLDLSGLAALEILSCGDNALETLTLTGCTALENLDCSGNALAALDLSGCTALEKTTQGSGTDKAENPALSPQYLPEQAAAQDGRTVTVDFSKIVGKANLGRVRTVTGAKSYSKTTGLAVFEQAPDYFSYTYDTGRKGLDPMRVSFEAPGVSYAVALDAAHFPDAAFRTYLAGACDRNGDGALSALELLRTDTLECDGLGIADLTGIAYFTSMTGLNCADNALTALDLSHNVNLVTLVCDGNALTTLDLTANKLLTPSTDTGCEQDPGLTCRLTAGENGGAVLDLAAIVGKDNTGNVLAVEGAKSYDRATGLATFLTLPKKAGYTYATGSEAVTLTVRLTLDGDGLPAAAPFTDVPAGQWYFDAVQYVYAHELMDGMGGGRFQPNGFMTRAMVVTVLYRMEGSPAVTGGTPFTDLQAGSWYADAVAWAYANEIVNGMTTTTFQPGGNVTREQLAAILCRYTAAKGGDVTAAADLSVFPDAGRVSDYAAAPVQWAVRSGLINGVAEGGRSYLRPQGSATRAQVATILMRYLEA